MRGSAALYELNTRVRLTERSAELGRRATLDDLEDAELATLAALGFDGVWLLGVWRTGAASRQASLTHEAWRREFLGVLPDLTDADVCGSGFAVAGYTVDPTYGGDAALARLRERLHRHGLRLVLDFVPNHTALDHPWATARPDFYLRGTAADLAADPGRWTRVGPSILAHGRAPFFPPWPDTLQLDWSQPALREAMGDELGRVADRCDGVRCDMAMLVLPDVFQRTWGVRSAPFWPDAIARVRARHADFVFIAEVYWDLEATLLAQGFDYAYDKRLYDRLRARAAGPVRAHLGAEPAFQARLVRFLENHDEARAAAAFPPDAHRAAAVVTYLAPGLRLVHQGQLDGRRVRVPVHLCRAPAEPADATMRPFYEGLLACARLPAVQQGDWRLLEGDDAAKQLVAFAWESRAGARLFVAVNYGPAEAHGRVRRPYAGLAGRLWRFRDGLGDGAPFERDGGALEAHGLAVALPPWGYQVLDVTAIR